MDSRMPTSIRQLEKQFTSEPVLIIPDQTKPFQIECDALKYVSGAVLDPIGL